MRPNYADGYADESDATDITKKPITRFKWREQYDEEADRIERERTDIKCEDESLTQQQFKDDADLNKVVKRYGITDGSLIPMAADPRYYGDFTESPETLGEAIERVNTATERFNQLPAEVRKKFDNNPAKLYEFVTDTKNAEEAVKLGLLKTNKTPEEPPPAGT